MRKTILVTECDFCGRKAYKSDLIFVESPSKEVAICEKCVSLAVEVITEKKKEF
jgi:ribosomal protein L24E